MLSANYKPVARAMLAALFFNTCLGGLLSSAHSAQNINPPASAPQFTQTSASAWINSKPLALEDLRDKVVLLDFWTFGCWNCYRSFPWLKSLEARFKGQALQVIGVHTPEFEHEKIKANVVSKVKEFGLRHPVMIDNDFAYWNAMGNRYWPAYYLIDKQGRIRAAFFGETHAGDERAAAMDTAIEHLLAEER